MGRRMESRVCALYSFDDQGMLALERTYYDKAKILEQLGIFQDPRTTTGKVMESLLLRRVGVLSDEAARTDVQLGLEELAARVCTRP